MSDAMSKAATKAATFVTKLDFKLLAAANEAMPREARAHYLREAFAQWPKLCRAMAELEQTAPNAAQAGYEQDQKVRDFIEGRA